MAWITETICEITVETWLKILKGGLNSEHIAQLLSCTSEEDVLQLSWLGTIEGGNSKSVINVRGRMNLRGSHYNNDAQYDSDSIRDYYLSTYYTGTNTEWSQVEVIGDYEPYTSSSAKYDDRIAFAITNAKTVGNLTAHKTDVMHYTYIGFSVAPQTQIIYCNDEIIASHGVTAQNWNTAGGIAIRQGYKLQNNTNIGGSSASIGIYGWGVSGFPNNYALHDGEYFWNISCPIFDTIDGAKYYVRTGDDSGRIDGESGEIDEDMKYLYCDIMRNTQPIKNGASLMTNNSIELFYNKALGDYNGTRPIAGYVSIGTVSPSQPTYYNIHLLENDATQYTRNPRENYQLTGWVDEDRLETMHNPAWTWEDLVTVNNSYYYGVIDSNIPIFATYELAWAYLHGLVDESASIRGGGLQPQIPNKTGNELKKTDFNTVNGDAVGSETLTLNTVQVNEFFNTLFTQDDAIIEQIKKGLEMYGTDPASFIVDYFALPFDASVFGSITSSNNVSFGSYSHTFTNTMPRLSSIAPKMVDCFTTLIQGAFDDWRDYQSNYYLYLPYAGITALDIDKYLYKTLNVKVSVDIRTGQIKYYLLSNNVLVDTVETICRVSLPLESTNAYQNAREKMDAIGTTAGDLVNFGMSAGALSSGNLNGVGSMIGAIGGMVNDMVNMSELPKLTVSGTCSPSNAWLDPSYCYLLIHAPEFVYDGVTDLFNKPDNKVRRIGSCSGYTVVTDVKLQGCATLSESEKNALINELASGVFI